MWHLVWNLVWNLEFGLGMFSEEIYYTNNNNILNKCIILDGVHDFIVYTLGA